MTRYNSHYPFAQREYSFVFPWEVTKLPLEKLSITTEVPKGNGIDLFVDDITKVIDEPDLVPPFTFHNGEAKTHGYTATSATPSGLDSGWAVSVTTGLVRVFLVVRQQPSGSIDLQRPNRRVHLLHFGMTTFVDLAVTATKASPFGSYTISVQGYWRNWSGDAIPSYPDAFWTEADTPPTLHRLHQRGHRDYHRQFTPDDWNETLKDTLSAGTVPSTVSDFMDDWLDDLAADLAGATIDCTWRMAGIGWAIPSDLGNRNFIISSNAGRKY